MDNDILHFTFKSDRGLIAKYLKKKTVTIMIIISSFSSVSSDWNQMDTVNYETYETDGVYDSMEQNAPVAKVLLLEKSYLIMLLLLLIMLVVIIINVNVNSNIAWGNTGSFRKNGKSKTFFTGTKFQEKFIFSAFFSR